MSTDQINASPLTQVSMFILKSHLKCNHSFFPMSSCHLRLNNFWFHFLWLHFLQHLPLSLTHVTQHTWATSPFAYMHCILTKTWSLKYIPPYFNMQDSGER